MNPELDYETLCAVTAAIIKWDYDLHGTEPYQPTVNTLREIHDFSMALESAWYSLPASFRDINGLSWAEEIVPDMVSHCYEPGSSDYGDMKSVLIDYMMADFNKTDVVAYLKHHYLPDYGDIKGVLIDYLMADFTKTDVVAYLKHHYLLKGE